MNPLKVSGFTFGKFYVVEKIGTGGMSEVYLAKLKGPYGYEKAVALKVLLPHLAYDEDFINMLADEALIVSKLSHPNIVQVYEFGRVEDRYYICMEYVEGPDLSEFIRKFKEIPDEVSIFILGEVLKGLHYAHTLKDDAGIPLNIVHRDISPQNILIKRDGVVKLTDFGIARARGRLSFTRPGFIKGKCRYMSPEQVEGKEVDYRSDIFSTAVLAYELATGKKLFDGETETEIMRKIREVEPSITNDVDKRWFEPFRECLYREKERRPSAYALRQELLERFHSEYLEGEEVIKRMLENWSFPERVKKEHSIFSTVTKPVKKRRHIYAIMVFLLVCSLPFFLYFVHFKKGREIPLQVEKPQIVVDESPVLKENETKPLKRNTAEDPGYGFLTIHTEPWTHVFIDDGKEVITTPLVNLKLKAGWHKLRFVNEDYGIDKTIRVEVKKGETLKIKKRFRPNR